MSFEVTDILILNLCYLDVIKKFIDYLNEIDLDEGGSGNTTMGKCRINTTL